MTTPLRDYGSSPLDAVRRTLSLQLRAILYEEGIVDSPDLPLRPLPAEVVVSDSPASSTSITPIDPAQRKAA